MRVRDLTLFFTLAALTTAAAAAARPTFGGNVCGLLTAKQVTAIQGVSPRCTNAKPSPGFGSTIYAGNWSGKTARSPRVQVTVSVYTDQGALQLAKRNLAQGLTGTPRKVAGIGSGAYEATGAGAAGLRFASGKTTVLVIVTALGKPPSTKSAETLAKSIDARL